MVYIYPDRIHLECQSTNFFFVVALAICSALATCSAQATAVRKSDVGQRVELWFRPRPAKGRKCSSRSLVQSSSKMERRARPGLYEICEFLAPFRRDDAERASVAGLPAPNRASRVRYSMRQRRQLIRREQVPVRGPSLRISQRQRYSFCGSGHPSRLVVLVNDQ